MNSTRIYAKYDSAASLLSKLGIAKADYQKFVHLTDENKFAVDIEAANKHLETHAKKQAVVRRKKETCSDVARKLILKGKSNEQVWKILQLQFGLDETKSYYPTWYRNELKRKGVLSAD